MANIRKSFNFRTGLQVDNDNFVVNANGLVGIGTSIPQNYLLNVHGDTRVTGLTTTGTLYSGIGTIGILSATNADVSGILTVGQIKVGNSGTTDNLIGYGFTAWTTTDGGVGLHTLSRVGVATDATPPEEFRVNGDARVTGILTATSFDGSLSVTKLSGTLTNSQLPTNINKPTGIITSSSFVGPLTGNSTTASNLTGSPSITVTNVSASNVSASGIATVTTELNVGTGGTALTSLNSGRLGIGTALPTSELQIRKASGSLVEVISDSGQARISIGQSVGVGKSTGVIRFGNSANDLDIINNDNAGDINFLLNGNGSSGTGKFSWQDGSTFAEVMSLNANGNFSVLGVTTLASDGGITTTGGALYVNNNLSVGGTISASDYVLPSIISTNLNINTGISSVAEIHVDSQIGIGTNSPISDISGIGKTAYLGKAAIGYSQATSDINTNNLAVSGNLKVTGDIVANGFLFSNPAGIITAPQGFVSTGSTAIQIYVEGTTLVFNAVGVGSTSFALL